MKQLLTMLLLFVSFMTYAQQGINYKALIKDDNGNVLASQDIKVRFSIQEADGSGVYLEVHEVTTDANGLISLNIGEGVPGQFNDFTTIDWSAEEYYLRVAIDPEADGSYINFDAAPFKTVPYAFQSKTSDFAKIAESATFETVDNVTSNSPGDVALDDFVVGSPVLDDNGVAANDKRMFFDKSKGAFRAGSAVTTQWNEANIGEKSFAIGENTIASELTSTAMGYNTIASQIDATAMGTSTTASGISSLSAGANTKAESLASTAIGRYNVGGGNSSSWELDDPLFEVGNGISQFPSNALTIYKNGHAEISGRLQLGNEIRLGLNTSTATEGSIWYDDNDYTFKGLTPAGEVTLGAYLEVKKIVIPFASFKLNAITEDTVDETAIIYTSVDVRFISGHTDFLTGNYTEYFLIAPLILPVGSNLIRITYVFADNTPYSNYNFKIIKHCNTTNFIPELVTDDIYNIEFNGITERTKTLNETISDDCQYVMTIQAPTYNNNDTAGNSLRFLRAIITYTE